MTARNPWLGLASYDVPKGMEEDYLFCGRDEETMDIVRLIDNNLFITLYGSSGIGKTSLLKAGVIPILKRKDYFPLYVRLSQESSEIPYAEAIVRHLKDCGLTEESHVALEHADGNDRLFLWNYFATTRFLDTEGREIYPVIILDQFEEVFRDADKAKAELLLQQIYLLLNDELEMPDAEGYSADTNYRFVASIREDFLFVLEDSIDELSLDLYKNNRYRLRPMKPENARQVVLVPGRDCIEESEKEKVADRVLELAKKPQSNDIDTLLLSLVCAGTFDKKAGEKITYSDLSIWKDNPMQIYYQDAMRVLNANQIRYIQQHLIREDGSRKRVGVEELKKALGENDFQKLTKGKNRLFSIGDKGQVELLHDKLAMAVYEERKAFEERERKKKLRRRVSVIGILVLAIAGIFFFQNAKLKQQKWEMLENQSRLVAKEVISNAEDDSYLAKMVALEILPKDVSNPIDRPYTPEAEYALRKACEYNSFTIKNENEEGNLSYVNASYNSDGTKILTTTRDSALRIFNAKTGTLIKSFKRDQDIYFSDAQFSPDGKQILYKSDSIVTILDAESGNEKLVLTDTAYINSANYSPDGKNIITTLYNIINIWDIETGKILRTITGNSKKSIEDAIYTPDGKYIIYVATNNNNVAPNVTGGKKFIRFPYGKINNVVYALNASTYEEAFSLNEDECIIQSISLSRDGKYILSESLEMVSVWDIEAKKEIVRICDTKPYEDYGNAVISPNGKSLALCRTTSSTNLEHQIELWDIQTGQLIQVISQSTLLINSLAFSPDGEQIVYTSGGKNIWISDIHTNDEKSILVKCDSLIHPSKHGISNDGKVIVCSLGDSSVRIWDLTIGTEIQRLKRKVSPYSKSTFYPHGNSLITGFRDNDSCNIIVWDAKTGETQKTIIDSGWYYRDIVFSPDGNKYLRIGDRVTLWDSKTNMQQWKLDYSGGTLCTAPDYEGINNINSACFSPDGKKLVLAGYPIVILDTETGKEIKRFKQPHNSINVSIAIYSPDGKRIVSGSEDKTLKIWDAETGICIKVLEGHTSGVTHAAYSRDGKYIVSASADKTIRVWDAETGICVHVIEGHTESVLFVSFTPDGRHIISVSKDKTIRKWDFPPLQELIDQTRERFKDRPLTNEERKTYYLE